MVCFYGLHLHLQPQAFSAVSTSSNVFSTTSSHYHHHRFSGSTGTTSSSTEHTGRRAHYTERLRLQMQTQTIKADPMGLLDIAGYCAKWEIDVSATLT